MGEPRKQHHVPVVYLKQFAFGKQDYINVYDKVTGKYYCSSLDNVANKRDFYTVIGAKDEYAVEKFYAAHVEPLIKKCLGYIKIITDPICLEDNTKVLSGEIEIQLSYIMSFQLLRGLSARQLNRNTFEKMFESALIEALKKLGYSEDKKQEYINDEEKKNYVFKAASAEATLDIRRIEKYAYLFYNRFWYCLKIIGIQKEFITSDNPVMFINLKTYDATPFSNGILNPDTAIFFPISPQLMIASVYEKRCDCFINNAEDGALIYLGEKAEYFIDQLNQKHKEQAIRQVFAHDKNALKEC